MIIGWSHHLGGEKYPQGTDAFQSVYLLSPQRAPILLVCFVWKWPQNLMACHGFTGMSSNESEI